MNDPRQALARRLGALSPEKRRRMLEKLKEKRPKGAQGSRPPAIVPGPRPREIPLSFGQRRLWFLDRLEGPNPAYNIPAALEIRGPLHPPTLERCFHEIVRRHESLRTTFAETNGRPVQAISPTLAPPLHVVDLAALPEARRRAEADRLMEEEELKTFDLRRGPLIRISLLKTGPERWILLTTIHHAVYDGWSIGVMVKELTALYEAFSRGAPSPLGEPPIQYADFALWQRRAESGLEEHLAYWKRTLADAPDSADLPADRPHPPKRSYRGGRISFAVDADVTRELKRIAAERGATLFMVLLAAFAALLRRWGAKRDMVIGSPVSGRTRRELEPLIGFFVNTLAPRIDSGGAGSFIDLLDRVKRTVLEAYAHQEIPFERLMEALNPDRDMSRTPLFQVMFVWQNMPRGRFRLADLSIAPLETDRLTAKFDLTLFMEESDSGLTGSFEFSADIFDPESIGSLARYFRTLLGAAAHAPGRPVRTLPLMEKEEVAALSTRHAGAALDYPRDRCIHHLFEERVRRSPDAPAAVFQGREIDFRELNARANRLARFLRTAGVGPERVVGVHMERSLEMVVGILGVLKAGGAYLPLDPRHPGKRLAYMATDARIRALLARKALEREIESWLPGSIRTMWIEDEAILSQNADDLATGVAPENPAYVIHTSGSTGRPKGVMVPHRALVNHMAWMRNAFPLAREDRVMQRTPFGFDASVWEFYAPLLSGARLIMARPADFTDPARLAREIVRERITILQTTPTLLKALLEEGAFRETDALKRLFCGGEALSGEVRERLLSRFDGEMVNLYGPTEACIDATFWKCSRQGSRRRSPIGRPIANTRIYILDENLEPAPPGVRGELYIAGDGLARGYLDRPGRTAGRFIPDPFAPGPGARMYRSGDLARRLPDGAIEYLGRSDHQVKLRGFRVEPGEIEARITRHPAIREAVVDLRGEDDDKRLVAWFTTKSGEEASAGDVDEQALATELRARLKTELPDHMIPSAFARLEAIPLTPSGKTDRNALPAPAEAAVAEPTAPATPAEDLLATIWRAVLKRERVGPMDHFFDLGGHSLMAARVISRIRDGFGVEIPLRALFEHPVLKDLAAHIDDARRGETLPPLIRMPENVPIPLSYAQRRLWFLDRLEGASGLYNMPAALNMTGRLDADALRWAIKILIRRHDSPRMKFPARNGRPEVKLLPAYDPLASIDLQSLDPGRREAEVRRLAADHAWAPFDLGVGPLLRVCLIRTGASEHILLFTMHHIISDGWSMGLLVRELGALYGARVRGREARLPAPAIRYRDYAWWQRRWLAGETLQRQIDYWKKQLSGVPELLDLPADRPRPSRPSRRGATLLQRMPGTLVAGLNRLGREQGATLFMTLLTAFNVLLHRCTGQRDICVGSPAANRRDDRCEEIIGFFVNTLVLRTRIDGAPDFVELLEQVRQTCLDAHAHQDVPFEHLVERVRPARSLSHAPLFQVMFVLQNAPMEDLALPGLRLSPAPLEAAMAKFDLTLSVEESENGLACAWEYNTDLFDEDRVRRMAGHYRRLLTCVVENPRQAVGLLPMLAPDEERLLRRWNETDADHPRDRTIVDLFEQRVRENPDGTAVVVEDRRLSYGALNRRANRLARRLIDLDAGHADDADDADDADASPRIADTPLVGLLVERGPEMIVGLLGVLKAGAAYVPLDPEYPKERLAYMLEDSRASVLLTLEKLKHRFAGRNARIICLDGDREAMETRPDHNPGRRSGPDDPAYVIYTSGSTGRPKGVMVEHHGVTNLVMAQTRSFHVNGRSRVLQFASISFDAAVSEIAMALCNGASLHLAAGENPAPGPDLVDFLKRRRITHITLPPSILAVLPRAELPDLTILVVAGEACSADLVAGWSANRRFINAYGPTEYSVCATIGECVDDGRKPSIGRPIANTRIHILDDHLQQAPVGVPGELCIGGEGLARGYLGRPGLTAERFIPNPFGREPGERLYKTGDLARWTADGAIEFLGRIDHQVKIRGFRVEPGEIEAVLSESHDVKDAVVVAREERPGDGRLDAYVVLRGGAGHPPPGGRTCREAVESDAHGAVIREIRAHLEKSLPGYMIPAALTVLERMPMTPNLKIDRKALPAPTGSGGWGRAAGGAAPRTPMEEMAADVFAEILELSHVGAHDDFFDLGGHSLLATRVVSRLRRLFSVDLPVRALFEAPTPAELCEKIEEARGDRRPQAPPIRARAEKGRAPLSFAQERLWFLDALVPGNPFYNIPTALVLEGALREEALANAFNEMIRRHETLRTTFTSSDGAPRQVIAPSLSLAMSVVDLRHLPGKRRMAEARRLAAREAAAPFDLEKGPLLRAALLKLGAVNRKSGGGGSDSDARPAPSSTPPAPSSTRPTPGARRPTPGARPPGPTSVLLITMHHIVSDGWSMGVLVREMAALYRAFSSGGRPGLAGLPVQYADFAEWQRKWMSGEVMERQLAHWRRRLEGAPAVLSLPLDRPRPPVQTFRGGAREVEIDPALTGKVKALGRERGASLFMTLLAAFSVLLSRFGGGRDLVIGSPIANRVREEIEPLIGFFVNTLALRIDLSGDPSFHGLLDRVRETALDAYAHQDLPFEKLVDELKPERDMSRNPLVQVSFALQNAPMPLETLPDLAIGPLELPFETVRFDMEFQLTETAGGLSGHMTYAADLFDAGTVERMAACYHTLLAAAADDPARPVSRLPLLTRAERRRRIEAWNPSRGRAGKPGCVHRLVEARAKERPDAAAAVFGERVITRDALNRRANGAARRLAAMGVGPGDRVGALMPRSPGLIAAMLGVFKAGGAWLPLDPDLPPDRLRFMLEDSRARALLTRRGDPDLPGWRGPVVRLDEDGEARGERGGNVDGGASPDHVAHVIYTSGSTGAPKGVAVTHGALYLHCKAAMEAYALTPGDRVLQFASPGFDPSLEQILPTLMAGASAAPAGPDAPPPGRLTGIIEALGITTANLPPAYFRELVSHWAERPGSGPPRSLRRLIVGGDVLDAETAAAWRRLPKGPVDLFNAYGPTEAVVTALLHPVPPRPSPGEIDRGRVPIGRPLGPRRMYILDDRGAPVPGGVPGELHIGGPALADHYPNRPGITAGRFVPDPFAPDPGARMYRTGDRVRCLPDGSLEFLGRLDDQVKIRGYRIEPGEIEAVLREHESVRDAAATARVNSAGAVRLTAYATVDPGAADARGKEAGEEQVSQWRRVFDENFGRTSPSTDPAFNIAGWDSSYTGLPIPGEEMREWVDGAVDRILSFGPDRVWEIGCGVGLLLARIAPRCSRYLGTDFSASALAHVRKMKKTGDGLERITLRRRTADDFRDVEDGSFDAVVINSVVQYFPDLVHLSRVMEGAVRKVAPGGVVFVGDVRDFRMLEAFHLSVQTHRAPASLAPGELRSLVNRAAAQEEELLVHPAFFTGLRTRIPGVSHVRILPRRGAFHNEMTRFRYDAVLHVGGAPPPPVEASEIRWRDGAPSPGEIRAILEKEAPESLVVRGIANARTWREARLLRWARGGDGTVGRIRETISNAPPEGIDPEELWRMAGDLPFSVEIECAGDGADGAFDALFTRGAPGAFPREDDAPPPGKRLLANDPLRGRLARRLAPRLRRRLEERLPSWMTPSAIVILETFPRTPGGKIDRKALPAPDRSPEMDAAFIPPKTPGEEILAGIWAEILGIARVGIRDNFFELGGDSILGIRIVARAARAGLALAPRDLFQHQTVEELAAVAGHPAPPNPDAPSAVGPTPLTPIQREFFGRDPASPHHFNQSVLLELKEEIAPDVLETAVRELMNHHDALRMRFAKEEGEWRQHCPEPGGSAPLEVVNAANGSAVTTMAGRLQTTLDLARGPLARAALFRLRDGAPSRLLIIIHHLVVDGVSWRILLEDLESAVEQARRGETIRIPDKTGSFRQWSERLTALAGSADFAGERSWWLSEHRGEADPLPLDDSPEGVQNTMASSAGVSVSLGRDKTGALLREVPRAYGTRINDALIAALYQALAAWTGAREVRIDLEGHGREDLFPDVDLSRTVGWFTSLFPVRVAPPVPPDGLFAPGAQGAILKSVKETLRRIPGQGVGHGVLKHLTDDREIRESPRPDLCFNYLGQLDPAFSASSLFKPANESPGPMRSPDEKRPHLLEVNASTLDGRLRAEWRYGVHFHKRETVETLAKNFIRGLEAIIDHCLSPGAGGFTPSDFPDADLDQQELDDLLDDLDEP